MQLLDFTAKKKKEKKELVLTIQQQQSFGNLFHVIVRLLESLFNLMPAAMANSVGGIFSILPILLKVLLGMECLRPFFLSKRGKKFFPAAV